MKRYQRNIIRVFSYTLLFFIVIFTILFFVPLRSGYVNERIRDAIRSVSGLELNFEDCVLYLSQGRLTIHKPGLFDPARPENQLAMENAEFIFSPWQIFNLSNLEIKRIEIENPSPINLIVENNSIRFSKEVELLKKLVSIEPTSPGAILPERIILNNAMLNFEVAGRSQPVFSLRDSEIYVSTSKEKIVAAIKGNSTLQDTSAFRATFNYLPALKMVEFLWQSGRIEVGENQINVKGLSISADKLKLTGHLSFTDKKSLDLNILGTNLHCRYPEQNIDYQSPAIKIGIKAWEEENKIQLSLFECEARKLKARAEGSINYSPPREFRLTVEEEEIPVTLLGSFTNRWIPENVELEVSQTAVSGNLSIEGGLQPFAAAIKAAEGEIRNIELRHQLWPFPIVCHAATFKLRPYQISLAECSAETNNIRLDFDAQLNTRAFLAGVIDISSKWSLAATADKLKESLFSVVKARDEGNFANIEAKGEIRGKGELNLDFTYPLAASIQTGSNRADFLVNDVIVNHPALPGELSKITGKISLTPRELVFQELVGQFLQTSFAANGSLKGTRYFWLHPEADVELSISSSGEDLKHVLSSYNDKWLIPTIEGQVESTIQVKGPLDEPKSMALNSHSNFQHFSYGYNGFDFPIVLNDLNGDVEITIGHSMTVKPEFNGFIWDFPFDLCGDMSDENLNLSFNAFVDLEKAAQIFSTYLADFRMSGMAEVKAWVNYQTLKTQPISEQPASSSSLPFRLYNYINFIQEFVELLRAPQYWQDYITAKIETKDGLFAHRDMPLDVHHINGSLDFRDATLYFKDATLSFGKKTPEVAGSGRISFLPPAPGLVFQAWSPEFHLEEWIEGWRPHRPGKGKRPETLQSLNQGQLAAYISGEMKADKIYYHQLEGQDFEGKLDYESFLNAPNKLHYYDIKTGSYEGESSASGLVLFSDEGNFYEVTTNYNGISLAKLLKALGYEKTRISGRLSGQTSLTGKGNDLQDLKGETALTIEQSRFIRHPIFTALGKVTHIAMFEDISFVDINGNLSVENATIESKDLIFENPLLNLKAEGKAGFDKSLDFDVYLAILSPQLIDKVPWVGRFIKGIADAMYRIGSAALKFHLTGTLEKPRFEPVPLSIDEMTKVLQFFSGKP